MELIKRHKNLAIVLGLTLILLIVMFIFSSRMIFQTGETVYGNRLEGLVKIDESVTKDIIESTKQSDVVEDITIRTQGKIIYTTITFKKGTKLSKAKEIANSTLAKYSEEVLGYYDFGYILKENVPTEESNEEQTGFVSAGTKHPKNDKISWTKS